MKLVMALLLAGTLEAGPKAAKVWRWSLVALAAANAADVASSVGQYERNPVLGKGRLGARAIGIKVGVAGGTVVLQAVLRRKHPAAARPFAIANFATAAGLSGLAARNWHMPRIRAAAFPAAWPGGFRAASPRSRPGP